MRMNPNVNCGLWGVVLCHWKFITLHLWDVQSQGVVPKGGRGYGNSAFTQFCYEPKTTLKNKTY